MFTFGNITSLPKFSPRILRHSFLKRLAGSYKIYTVFFGFLPIFHKISVGSFSGFSAGNITGILPEFLLRLISRFLQKFLVGFLPQFLSGHFHLSSFQKFSKMSTRTTLEIVLRGSLVISSRIPPEISEGFSSEIFTRVPTRNSTRVLLVIFLRDSREVVIFIDFSAGTGLLRRFTQDFSWNSSDIIAGVSCQLSLGNFIISLYHFGKIQAISAIFFQIFSQFLPRFLQELHSELPSEVLP